MQRAMEELKREAQEEAEEKRQILAERVEPLDLEGLTFGQ